MGDDIDYRDLLFKYMSLVASRSETETTFIECIQDSDGFTDEEERYLIETDEVI